MVPVPIKGAFHALHLELPDLESIMGSSSLLDLQVKPRTSLILGSGRELKSKDMVFKSLMREALTEILKIPQYMSAVEDTLGPYTRGDDSRISLIGPTNFPALTEDTSRTSQARSRAPSTTRKLDQGLTPSVEGNDIAVVGMSGRFPESDKLEELWEILVQGRDLCRQVRLLLPRIRID